MNTYLLEYVGFVPGYNDFDFIQKEVKADSEEEAISKAGFRTSEINVTLIKTEESFDKYSMSIIFWSWMVFIILFMSYVT